MPVFENGERVAISQGAGMVIAKSGKEKEYASAVFLKWFTEPEQNVPFSLSSSYLPVKKSALDEKLLNASFDIIDSGDTGIKNSIKSLKVGLDQLRDYTMYSSEVFDGSAAFRNKLPEALANAVQDDKEAYFGLVREGTSPEAAYKKLLEQSWDKFDQWIEELGE